MNRLDSFLVGLGLAATTFALAVPEPVEADSTDHQLTISWPSSNHTLSLCAKTRDSCETVKKNLWQPLDSPPIREATIDCQPSPNCFSSSSNCIQGYNCK